MHMFKAQREWTVDDLQDMPDDGNRYEIIDGELFASPSPIWRHQEAVFQLHHILTDYLGVERIGHAFSAPADIPFSPTTVVQPDVFVVPLVNGRRPANFQVAGRLLVAAEVSSPGTARLDRVKKRALFRREGVAEYWIVDLDARTFERSTPAELRPEILAERLEWFPEGASAPLVIDLVDYFAKVFDEEI